MFFGEIGFQKIWPYEGLFVVEKITLGGHK